MRRCRRGPATPWKLRSRSNDGALAALGVERLPSRLFGVDAARFQHLPGLHEVACPEDCGAVLAEALAAGHRRIRIENDLQLAGPSNIGSPERPVLLVVEGNFRLSDGIRIHGAIVQLSPQGDTSDTHDARISGAVFAAGDVVGDGTPTIEYDRAILAQLHREVGVFVRVPGSWRDF